MKSKPVLCLFFAAVLFATLIAAGAAVLRAPAAASSLISKSSGSQLGGKDSRLREMVAQSFLHLPLRFEENVGQTDSRARFLARGPGYSLFLTPDSAVLALRRRQEPAAQPLQPRQQPGQLLHSRAPVLASGSPDGAAASAPEPHSTASVIANVSLTLLGANPSAMPEGLDPLPGKSNYLIGNDPAQWRTAVTSYSKVKYRAIYPGVDLVYYGNPQQLEYDFVVAPGASPSQIEMQVAGGAGMHLDTSGNLVVATGAQPVQLHKPVLYQQTPEGRREIAGNFRLRGENSVGFEVAAYDPRLPLVIDPVLSYSTYLGGLGDDEINAITLDPNNNICVTGFTNAQDFPTSAPFRGTNGGGYDAFVTELSADGSQLIFSTYLGGNGFDAATGIAVDSSGNVTVGGYTYSTNFPIASAFQSSNRASGNGGPNAFVARLNSAGSGLIFSTYYGGSTLEAALAVAIDASGSAYIAGLSESSNLPVANPFQGNIATSPDAFLAKFSPGGNGLVYATYLGGNAFDEATGIAVDGSGNAYVVGYTDSSNFPRANAVQNAFGGGTCNFGGVAAPCDDVFVAKLNASGSTLAYSTYLGGNSEDQGSAIAIDSSGNAYVTGFTFSGNFPTQSPIQGSLAGLSDAFVTKLGPGGNALIYSTYLGGTISDNGAAIQVDANGNAYVAGATGSSDFPTVNSFQPLNAQNSSTNAFVLKVTPDGSALAYSTYLGGSGFGGGGGDAAASLVLDSLGEVYVAGSTSSVDFPVVNAFQPAYVQAFCTNDGFTQFPCPDGFISKIVLSPKMFPNGIVNGASFAANSAVAAGSIVSAFGTDLTTTSGAAGTIPLPFTLANLTVRMNGIQTPFFFAAGGQLNLQVPWELAGQAQASVQVASAGANIAPVSINLAAAAPGIFSVNSSGGGQGAILNSSDSSFAAPAGSIIGAATRPANRGDFVTIYCTGLGPVSNRPNTGFAAGGNSLTTTTPVVTIGGIQVVPSFSGLAPTFVGLYQINVQVPANAQTGSAVPVAISINGAASNTVQIAVQ